MWDTPLHPTCLAPPGLGHVGHLGLELTKGCEYQQAQYQQAQAVWMEMEIGDSGFTDLSH